MAKRLEFSRDIEARMRRQSRQTTYDILTWIKNFALMVAVGVTGGMVLCGLFDLMAK